MPLPPGFQIEGEGNLPPGFTLEQAEKKGRETLAQVPYNVGAKATDWASQYLPPGGAAIVGTAANVGLHALPMLLGGGMGKAVEPLLESLGTKFMRSAIKPLVQDLERGKVEPAIKTMLEQGYSPTNAGVKAMRDKAGEYAQQVDQIIAPSNKLVNISAAEQNTAALADKLRPGTRGPSKIEDVKAAAAELRAHPNVDNAGLMSVQDAQAMKQANYKDIGPSGYGLNVKEQTARDALKAQTAALREEIEAAHPEVGALNQKAGELINAAKVSQRRALIEGNKDPLPIGASLATALHNPAAALGMYANSSAAVKSLLARLLYSSAGHAPGAGAISAGTLAQQLGQPPKE